MLYISQWARERYQNAVRDGICTRCFKTKRSERSKWRNLTQVCDACHPIKKANDIIKHNRLYQKWIDNNCCRRCGLALHPEADVGRVVCFSCRMSISLYSRGSVGH